MDFICLSKAFFIGFWEIFKILLILLILLSIGGALMLTVVGLTNGGRRVAEKYLPAGHILFMDVEEHTTKGFCIFLLGVLAVTLVWGAIGIGLEQLSCKVF